MRSPPAYGGRPPNLLLGFIHSVGSWGCLEVVVWTAGCDYPLHTAVSPQPFLTGIDGLVGSGDSPRRLRVPGRSDCRSAGSSSLHLGERKVGVWPGEVVLPVCRIVVPPPSFWASSSY